MSKKMIENLQKAYEKAAISRYLVRLEVMPYGILIRTTGKDADGNICEIGDGVPWEALELDGVLENQIEFGLLAIDNAIKYGDRKLTA